jgi:hypothetical protein
VGTQFSEHSDVGGSKQSVNSQNKSRHERGEKRGGPQSPLSSGAAETAECAAQQAEQGAAQDAATTQTGEPASDLRPQRGWCATHTKMPGHCPASTSQTRSRPTTVARSQFLHGPHKGLISLL